MGETRKFTAVQNPFETVVPGGFQRSQVRKVESTDEEYLSPAYLRRQIEKIVKSLGDLAALGQSVGHVVDEYQVQANAESGTQVSWQPDYETPEVIECIIVTGPPTASPATIGPTFTLTLGKRNWTLALPASGILPIAPVKISLDRSDRRTLIAGSAGNWSIELCGYAEKRHWLR